MKDAGERTRNCDERTGEILLGKDDTEPSILHPDFDRNRAGGDLSLHRDASSQIPHNETEGMQTDDCKNEPGTRLDDLIAPTGNDRGHDQGDGGDGDERSRR